jgi:hypothetical protein
LSFLRKKKQKKKKKRQKMSEVVQKEVSVQQDALDMAAAPGAIMYDLSSLGTPSRGTSQACLAQDGEAFLEAIGWYQSERQDYNAYQFVDIGAGAFTIGTSLACDEENRWKVIGYEKDPAMMLLAAQILQQTKREKEADWTMVMCNVLDKHNKIHEAPAIRDAGIVLVNCKDWITRTGDEKEACYVETLLVRIAAFMRPHSYLVTSHDFGHRLRMVGRFEKKTTTLKWANETRNNLPIYVYYKH